MNYQEAIEILDKFDNQRDHELGEAESLTMLPSEERTTIAQALVVVWRETAAQPAIPGTEPKNVSMTTVPVGLLQAVEEITEGPVFRTGVAH